MTHTKTDILTHYTDIAEAKQRNVRQMQAQTARGIVRGIIAAIVSQDPIVRSRLNSEKLDQA